MVVKPITSAASALLVLIVASCAPGVSTQPPEKLSLETLARAGYPAVPPARAEETFEVQDGFRMRLIAGEPLVYDPVAIAYDENGRAYVAEMSDYPYTNKQTSVAWEEQTNQDPIGRIRLLEDRNGDGRFDESTVFADDLSWPTGLAVWKGGIYVTATPDIWYLKDTDGDGKADERRKEYTGFRKFNVQAVINNPQFGLDHQFYGAGASNGGTITSPVRERLEPVELGRNDFRFDPVTREFDAISGGARFGNSWDDWGNRFICHIRNPVMHVVLPDRYLVRNPYLVVPNAVNDVSVSGDNIPVFGISPPEPWRAIRAHRQATDPSYAGRPASEMVAQGYWTSSSGITVYRGDAYPAEYRDDVFIGEVANNVIHRQDLTADGVTFTSKRADPEAEFVASTDTWFRAVNLVNAPDGTLHVLDMYREVIEHPWSIPEDIHAELNLLSGTDRGRIYRLEPPDFEVPEIPRLGVWSTSQLVDALESANGWRRDTAHRLLYERQDRSAIRPLRKLLRTSDEPLAKVHALWSLEGLDALESQDLLTGLEDDVHGVREHAVRLSERFLARSDRILERVLAMASDPSARVRFQVAFSLGEVSDDRVPRALAEILARDPNDQWIRTAALSSASEISGHVLAELFANEKAEPILFSQLARVVGARGNNREIGGLLTSLADKVDHEDVRYAVLSGLGDGLHRSGTNLREAADAAGGRAGDFVERLLRGAAVQVADTGLSADRRAAAAKVMAYDRYDHTSAALVPILLSDAPIEVQLAAVHALTQFDHPEVASTMLEGWSTYPAAVRSEVVEALLSRAGRTEILLDAIDSGDVSRQDIGETARIRLLRHRDDAIRARAESMFEPRVSREQVIARYRVTASKAGDAEEGRLIYRSVCASCHEFRGAGVDIGPNLASVTHKTPMEILIGILDPNREVSPEYELYEVEMKDGQTVTGMIAAETSSSITLKRQGAVEEMILRQNIEAVRGTGRSMMPEGLEAAISEEEMADLLQFLLDA